MEIKTLDEKKLQLAANCVRMLSAEAVEKAASGHPGMPMGVAELGISLWLKFLTYNSQDPQWWGRDRFVLSNGHGSMFLYSLLNLAGYDLSMEEIKNFRQWDSKTPGHPEFGMTVGVEATTGPLGQGVANAVGMAIAQKVLHQKYYDKELKFSPFENKIFCMAGDGCMMEGISGEASSIAGHLGLDNLVVIYDDNHISIAGDTKLAFTEDVCKRYEAYGWEVYRAEGNNFKSIDEVLTTALNSSSGKPKFIAARTIIGKGSPNKANSSHVHGSPLGKEELQLTKQQLSWPLDKEFFIPEEVKHLFADRNTELKNVYTAWKNKLEEYSKKDPKRFENLKNQMELKLPQNLEAVLLEALPKDNKAISTRKLSETVLQALSANVNSLIGGSADLEPSTLTLIKNSTDIEKDHFEGLNLRFGVREHGMGGIMNGLSYYGGFRPYGSTFLCFSDYMRPSIRIAALSHLPSMFIFTHDSFFLGEDGPTHQPIEHINSLRMIPNLLVFRPADACETAISYFQAAEAKKSPSVLIFSRQNLAVIDRGNGFEMSKLKRGGYILKDTHPNVSPKKIFIATGSEVELALKSQEALLKQSPELPTRVISMPCVEIFNQQDKNYRTQVIPEGVPTVIVEAGTSFGWLNMLNLSPDLVKFVTMEHFGASAPDKVLAEKFGFTVANVLEKLS